MKTSKSEVAYFILSLILLALAAGIYVIFGHTNTTKVTPTKPKTTLTSSSSKPKEDFTKKADDLLKALEKSDKPTTEAVTNAKAAINKVTDSGKKAALQKRLDAISDEIKNEESAESAVASAEATQTADSVAAAQALVDVLTNDKVKADFQKRLDAVSAAIANTGADTTPAYIEEPAAQATTPETPAEPAAEQPVVDTPAEVPTDAATDTASY